MTGPGTIVRGIEYDMESFLRTTCEKYVAMVKAIDPTKDLKLKTVDNPFLEDDAKVATARRPIAEFPAVACPQCDASFPVWKKGMAPEHLCGGREYPKDWNGRLPFGSPIYEDEREFPLQQAKDVEAKAAAMAQAGNI